MNNHKCPEELVAAIERSRVLESLTPAQSAAFNDVLAERRREIERAYEGLNYQDRQITELRARIAELEAERAELVKDRERLKNGWALTAEGMLISNIHEVLHTSEDWKCCMMAMDDAGVPRTDDHGAVYSIWGRACWMLRSGDPLYQSDGQAIDAAREGE